MSIVGGGVQGFSGRTLAQNGTAGLPSYSFASDPDTGIYRSAANTLAIAVGGAKVGEVIANEFRIYGAAATNALFALYAGGVASFQFESQPASGAANTFYNNLAGGSHIFRNDTGNTLFQVTVTANAANYVTTQPGGSGVNAKISTNAENLQLMTGTALATGATAGMILVNACSGTPTGAPTGAGAGAIPMMYDTAANKIWFYNGSWRGVTVA